jgi:hypothetical protein
MRTPEGIVKDKVKAVLKRDGHYQFWPTQTGFGQQTVDCLACYDGKFLAIECKREGVERMTKRQELVMAEMRKAGADTWLVTLDEKGELKWIEIK